MDEVGEAAAGFGGEDGEADKVDTGDCAGSGIAGSIIGGRAGSGGSGRANTSSPSCALSESSNARSPCNSRVAWSGTGGLPGGGDSGLPTGPSSTAAGSEGEGASTAAALA